MKIRNILLLLSAMTGAYYIAFSHPSHNSIFPPDLRDAPRDSAAFHGLIGDDANANELSSQNSNHGADDIHAVAASPGDPQKPAGNTAAPDFFPLPSQGGFGPQSAVNMECIYPSDGLVSPSAPLTVYKLTLFDSEVHFCGPLERGVFDKLGEQETSTRMIEFKGFSKIFGDVYLGEFVFGPELPACPRCELPGSKRQVMRMECRFVSTAGRACIADNYGPRPDLGPEYTKALRNVGKDAHIDISPVVPWVTLYSGKDFVVYLLVDTLYDMIYTYDADGNYRVGMTTGQFKADVKARLARGYQLHTYSTSKKGLAEAGKVIGFSLK